MEAGMKISVVLQAFDKMTSVVNRSVSGAERRLSQFSKRANEIGDKAFGVGKTSAALGLATGVPLLMLAKAAEAEATAKARITQIYKSMGVEMTAAAKGGERFAESLSMDVAADKDKVRAVQAKLATFGAILKSNTKTAEIFNRATAAAFDLEAAGFGDAAQSSVQLGKALQDPIKGITALARSGVTFTEQEKKKIAAMVQSGRLFDAQKYLLKAIENQVGGVAKATANDTDKMAVAFEDIKKSIGAALLPTLAKLTTKFVNDILPAIKKFVAEHGPLIEKVLKGAAAFSALMLAVSAGAFVFGGIMKVVAMVTTSFSFLAKVFGFVSRIFLMNPIGLAITAIAIAAFLIYKYWEPIKAFFSKLWETVKQIFSKAWQWIKVLFLNFTPAGLVVKHWDKLAPYFAKVWGLVKAIISGAWQGIKTIFLNFTPAGLVVKHWGRITGFFSGLLERVKGIFFGFVKWFTTLHTTFFNAGANIAKSIWQGIKSFASKPFEAVKGMVQKVRNLLPFSPAKEGPLRDIHRIKLVETIAQSVKPNALVDRMRNVAKLTFNAASGNGGSRFSSPGARPAAGGMNVTFNISLNGGATNSDAKTVVDEIKKQFPQLMKQFQDRQNRLSFG